MIRYMYDFNGLFLYPYECQIDPLESEIKGEPVYMIPANSTDLEPPEIQDGETLRFVDGAWTIKKPPEPSQESTQAQPTLEERTAALESAMLSMMGVNPSV